MNSGVQFGRPKKDISAAFIEKYNAWKNGEITATAAYKALGMSDNTFYRRVKEYEAL